MVGSTRYECFDKPFPAFEFNNFRLRELRNSDAADYFYYMNHPDIAAFLSAGNCPSSLHEAEQDLIYWSGMFRQRRGFYWGITNNEDTKLIGTVGFNTLSLLYNRGELSYDLAREYWGQGIMRKSIKQIIAFSQDVLQLVRLQAVTLKSNKHSVKLLEKSGFSCEGTLRKYEYLNNQNVDASMYSKILNS